MAHKNAARNREKILLYSYLLGVCLLLFRLMVHIISIIRLYINSDKVRHSQVTLLINHRLKNSFSFFRWIFIPNEFSDGDEKDHIIIHERIHALQYHSVDLLLIELLSAVMWFNPLVWMMKKSVQLVHEYLADKGVLSTGIDKIRYQALLINHVAEERLICLSSGFNPVSQPGRYSLIKKRMIMMTKSKLNHGSKLKLWILIPLAAILFTGVACINSKNRSHVVTAVAPVKMNVLYLGLDNPVKIAASGYDASELTVTMENGRISGENGEYIIRPIQPGMATVTVICKGKEIQKTTFRVKNVPNPHATIAGRNGGIISKDLLLKQEELRVEMGDFDFDLNFEVTEFTVSAVIKGFVREFNSKSNQITDNQKNLIKVIKPGQKVYFQDIKCKGPDGTIRDLSPIALNIID